MPALLTTASRRPNASSVVVDEVLGAGEVGHVVGVDHALATQLDDLVDHLRGGPGGATRAVELGADVVHHDLGALPRELERVGAAQPPCRSGDDDDPTVADAAHEVLRVRSMRGRRADGHWPDDAT